MGGVGDDRGMKSFSLIKQNLIFYSRIVSSWETLSETRLQLTLENSRAENEVIGQIEVKTWQHFLILYLVKKL